MHITKKGLFAFSFIMISSALAKSAEASEQSGFRLLSNIDHAQTRGHDARFNSLNRGFSTFNAISSKDASRLSGGQSLTTLRARTPLTSAAESGASDETVASEGNFWVEFSLSPAYTARQFTLPDRHLSETMIPTALFVAEFSNLLELPKSGEVILEVVPVNKR